MSLLYSDIEPFSYEWKEVAGCLKWQRRALATESLWIHRPKDIRELFLSGKLTLTSPATYSALQSAVQDAWLLLRFEVPELALTTECMGENGYLQYEVRREDEIARWLQRTIKVVPVKRQDQNLKLSELREEILSLKQGHDVYNAFLLIRAELKPSGLGGDDMVQRLKFVLNVDHQVTDGIGIKILLDRYLLVLANSLGKSNTRTNDSFDWKQSVKNLTMPWICTLNRDQEISGNAFDKRVALNRQFMIQKISMNPGIPLLHTSNPPMQESHSITLTSHDTTQLLHSIKSTLGQDSNITHLGHAAMILAILRYAPILTPSSGPLTQTHYSPCWLNGRRYLNVSSGSSTLSTKYIPNCLSFAEITFPDIASLALSQSAGKEEIRGKLIKACRMATKSYAGLKKRSVLPECIQVLEELAQEKFHELQQVPAATQRTSKPRTAEPFFLSDGLTEQYISHTYSTSPGSASQSQEMFKIDDIRFVANAETNLIVRVSSWRGRTTISGEWRGDCHNREMAVGFLEDVVRIMMEIVKS